MWLWRMVRTIRSLNRANFSQFPRYIIIRCSTRLPGDEIRLASLFSGDAPRIRKNKKRRSEYPECLVVCFAGANTLNAFGNACSWWGLHLVFGYYGTYSVFSFVSWLMCRVSKDARITDGTAYSLYTATPLPFVYLHFADIVDVALLTTLSLYLCTNRCHSLLPIWSAHASCRLILWLPTSTLAAWLVAITLVLRLTGWIPLALSLASPIGTVPSALVNSYFFISILILALYLFILREVTKRVPF